MKWQDEARKRMADLELRVWDGSDDRAYCLRLIAVHAALLRVRRAAARTMTGLEPRGRVELPTVRLQGGCSTTELTRRVLQKEGAA